MKVLAYSSVGLIALSLIVVADDRSPPPPTVTESGYPHGHGAEKRPRLKIQLLADGTIELHGVAISTEQLTAIIAMALEIQPNVRLHIHSDKKASVQAIRRAVEAAGKSGLNDIIFSMFERAGD